MTDEEQPPSDQPEEGMAPEEAPFDEFEGEGGGTKFKDLIDNNPMVKFGLVGAVIITLIGGFMMFGGKKPQQAGSFIPRGAEIKEAPGKENVSQNYAKAIEDVNKANVEKAIKGGGSSLPIPVSTPQGKIGMGENAQPTEDPLERWRRIQDERTRREQEQKSGLQQKDPNAQAIKDMAQAMSQQMQSILAGIKPVKMQNHNVTTVDKLKELVKDWKKDQQEALNEALGITSSATGTGTGTGPNGQNGGGGSQQPVEILIPAGSIGYAQLVTGANSDYKQPVLGVIVGGPLAGDRIIGAFQHGKDDDYMVLTFKKVIIDGISHDINALAVDPASDYSNLATDVDHHYFKRVVIPGAVAFIQALAEGVAEPGQSTSQSTTSTVITTPKLKPAQYFWKGLGKSTEKVGDTIDKMNKDVDTTVVVAPGTPIGLIFIDPVTDQASGGVTPG
ncbi:MAG TPA: TrbI/VirB10 family protein [Patescibacteria group bacterium]|nr:TrbI/VirB10 family protein [Patescibacteria group bacterium]